MTMAIATIELIIFGGAVNLEHIIIKDILTGILNFNPAATYFLAITILIFAPILNLINIIYLLIKEKDFKFSLLAILLLIIMLSAMIFKK
jgi:uncharacterized membrane protein